MKLKGFTKKEVKQETNKKVYLFYTDFLLKKGRPPSLQDISDNFGFTRERSRQILERMSEEGYLLKEGKGNKVKYKPDWINKN